MKLEFKSYPDAKTMEAKVTAARRAEGAILTIVRDLASQGIILTDVYVTHTTSHEPLNDKTTVIRSKVETSVIIN